MKKPMWKLDKINWTVREVETINGNGRDSDGDFVYGNTHFTTEALALAALEEEVKIKVAETGRKVEIAKQNLALAQANAGEAAIAFSKAMERITAGAQAKA